MNEDSKFLILVPIWNRHLSRHYGADEREKEQGVGVYGFTFSQEC